MITIGRYKLNLKDIGVWIYKSLRFGGWAPILVFGFHLMAVYVLHIYSYFYSFDIPMHFIGGMAITFFFIESTFAAYDLGMIGKPSIIGVVLLIFLLTSTTTIFWEFAEWFMDTTFQTFMQVSLEDTLLDMLLGMLGGAMMIWLKGKYIYSRLK